MRCITWGGGNKDHRGGIRILDKETGIVYPSVSSADKAILGYRTSQFTVLTRYPERFCRWYPYMEEQTDEDRHDG